MAIAPFITALFILVIVVLVIITFIAYFRATTPVWIRRTLLIVTIVVGTVPIVILLIFELLILFA